VRPPRPPAGVRRPRRRRRRHLAGRTDQKYSLGFPLLADTDHAVAEAWGTWGEKTYKGKTYLGIIRSSFLVDEDGRIERAWYKVKPENTVPEAQAALAA
jgi:peroxiredoxin Q/BCP